MSSSRQSLTLKASLAELDRLVEFVEAFCAPHHATDADRNALHLALEEAFTNAVTHGYQNNENGKVVVDLEISGRQITATVIDQAPPFDPLARPEVNTSAPLEERAIGGLGVHFLKKLMDSAHYARRDGNNVLTLVRTIGGAR